MAFEIDHMHHEDVPEVMAIERDSFLTPWPASAYKRELNENRSAHYLVLRLDSEKRRSAAGASPQERKGFLSRLFPIHRLREPVPATDGEHRLAGYAGLWLMVDEAHITTIAIRPQYRGRGLGELMLISLAEIAMQINARWLTLEVRVSNEVAQALYRKYGFKPAGIRQRYYSDNQEDALIMWTDEITTPEFKDRFGSLREQLLRRLEDAGDLARDSTARPAKVR